MTGLRAAIRARAKGDAGLSLIELLVTMILMAVVSTLVVAAVSQSGRVLTQTTDEAAGLGDAKVILDRLGRDIREARSTECDGGPADLATPGVLDAQCDLHLQLWVDEDSDYRREDSEIITWRLQLNPDGIHYDVWRTKGLGGSATSHRQASSLIVQMVFQYDATTAGVTDFDAVQEVKLHMRYDSNYGHGSGEREVAFAARLRNKG